MKIASLLILANLALITLVTVSGRDYDYSYVNEWDESENEDVQVEPKGERNLGYYYYYSYYNYYNYNYYSYSYYGNYYNYYSYYGSYTNTYGCDKNSTDYQTCYDNARKRVITIAVLVTVLPVVICLAILGVTICVCKKIGTVNKASVNA
jgi:hypothetical protein